MGSKRAGSLDTLVAIFAFSLASCVAGPQPEPPGDPFDAGGGAAARDAARATSDAGPTAPDGSVAPPAMPPPAADAGADDLADTGMTPGPPLDADVAETDGGVDLDGGLDDDATFAPDAATDAGSADLDAAMDADDDAGSDDPDSGPLESGPSADASDDVAS